MVSLSVLFYIFIVLFAIIGLIRGFRKEIVVTVAGILSLFIIELVLPKIFGSLDGTKVLIMDLLVLAGCAFFGYQTPGFRRFSASGRFERDSMLDFILGALAGALNGYIFFSSAWFYLAKAGYPFVWISAPDPGTGIGQAAIELLADAFPNVLTGNWLYIALAAAVAILLAVII
ncbi:MAG: hypothetical protein PHW11_03175 [Anaerolineaceae bacterium]|jgi:uncharacterized membrane protein required for colicin V production|nr:hypothetical protein [Anaerolineaceae bacterium]MDD4042408.1 hypothetical protein [Anaerolineaceae bacterium]MDD4578931.1 hypothetical protein [Anaerolineaceae bacterium]